MKLAELLEKTEYTVVSGNVDVEVKNFNMIRVKLPVETFLSA